MKYYELLIWSLWGFFLLSETVNANPNGEDTLLSNPKRIDLYQAGSNFKCPFPFGNYPDPEDCDHYYFCFAGRFTRKKCGMFQKFDVWRKTCMPSIVAVCWNNKDKTEGTSSSPSVTDKTTSVESNFICPSIMGKFPYPYDCSKYYNCFLYRYTLKACPEKELFDAVKKECKPENEVQCGDRRRPGFTTTSMPTETTESKATETITEGITTATATETITEGITTATETITEGITTATATETIKEDITTASETDTTTDSITTVSSTETDSTITATETETTTDSKTETVEKPFTNTDTTIGDIITTTTNIVRPTGPPKHNCDEDDIDCIITETGDPENWFICPRDVGAYPHPSSDKLFIFCMNWIPSAKRCGLDLVFSKELKTCIKIKLLF